MVWKTETGSIEIRTQRTLADGSPALDEILVQGGDAFIHVEQMSHDSWWIGIDAAGKSFHLNFCLDDASKLDVSLHDQAEDGEMREGDNRNREADLSKASP